MDDSFKDMNDIGRILSEVNGDLNPGLVKKKAQAFLDMWKNLELKEILLRQKYWLDWIKDDDLNSRFFHNSMKERNRRNYIAYVDTNLGILYQVEDVKGEVGRRFERKF